MWIIFAVILIVVIYFINNSKSNENPGRSNQTSLDILKERYAKGEISEEDFEKMKKNLTS
jgi:putative membrane protein